MSKRPQRPLSQKSLSQPGPARRQKLTNQTIEKESKEVDLTKEINKCVILILLKSRADNLIRKADLQKGIFTTGGGRLFDNVLDGAKKILLKVYGLRVELCEENKGSRVYAVFNALPYKKITDKDIYTDRKTKILDFLILAHIFMSDNKCAESSLSSFLKSLKLDIDVIHPDYNHIRDHINISMVRRKYLEVTVDSATGKSVYSWGSRAECAISKQEVLNFVATMFNCSPKTWKNQYEAAEQQVEVNRRIVESDEEDEEEMDYEEELD